MNATAAWFELAKAPMQPGFVAGSRRKIKQRDKKISTDSAQRRYQRGVEESKAKEMKEQQRKNVLESRGSELSAQADEARGREQDENFKFFEQRQKEQEDQKDRADYQRQLRAKEQERKREQAAIDRKQKLRERQARVKIQEKQAKERSRSARAREAEETARQRQAVRDYVNDPQRQNRMFGSVRGAEREAVQGRGETKLSPLERLRIGSGGKIGETWRQTLGRNVQTVRGKPTDATEQRQPAMTSAEAQEAGLQPGFKANQPLATLTAEQRRASNQKLIQNLERQRASGNISEQSAKLLNELQQEEDKNVEEDKKTEAREAGPTAQEMRDYETRREQREEALTTALTDLNNFLREPRTT